MLAIVAISVFAASWREPAVIALLVVLMAREISIWGVRGLFGLAAAMAGVIAVAFAVQRFG